MSEETNLKKIFSESKRKLLCLEVNPPRGIDCSKVYKRLDSGLGDLDFFNITDSALAKMRMSPIPFAAKLKEKYGVEPLVNFSCRDRNLIAIQGDLLAATMLGIRSVVALTGDAVSVGDSPDRKSVFEVNSVGLLNTIETLNAGKDLAGNALQGASQITPGVVVNPNARNPNAEIKKLKKKQDAGACYALSQPVFDEEISYQFFKEASKLEIPIFLGLLPLKTGKSALAIQKIPGIKISEKILTIAENDPKQDMRDLSFELCHNIIERNKDFVCGYHLISGAYPSLALDLLKEL